MTSISAVIIDDEEGSRTTLNWLLQTYCPEVQLLGTADSIADGISLIESAGPQLLFLDIELAAGTGFDVLDSIPSRDFEVVFVTAFDQYAVKAFQHSAVHYLLKPVNPEELKKAVARAAEVLGKDADAGNTVDHFQTLVENLSKKDRMTRLAVPMQNGFQLIHVDDIVRLESDGAYTNFFLSNGSKILASKTMKDFEDLLDERFFRIHRTHLINLEHLSRYIKGRGGSVIMSDGSEVDVSRYRKDELMEALAKL